MFYQAAIHAQSKHSPSSRLSGLSSLVMCGYQGWFRPKAMVRGEGWVHYGTQGRFDATHIHLDFCRMFRIHQNLSDCVDQPGRDRHGASSVPGMRARRICILNGCSNTALTVFLCSGFSALRAPEKAVMPAGFVWQNAFKASQKYGRSIAVMYDLSGLKPAAKTAPPSFKTGKNWWTN